MLNELSPLFGCPNCGSDSGEHLMLKIGTRRLSNGDYRQFIDCNRCGNCKHEWPLEDFSALFEELK